MHIHPDTAHVATETREMRLRIGYFISQSEAGAPAVISPGLRIEIVRHRGVASPAPALVQRGGVPATGEQDEPTTRRALIGGEVGPAVAVVIAADRSVARTTPADRDRRRVPGARLQPVPQTARRVVDDEVGLAVAVVVTRDRNVSGAANALRQGRRVAAARE